MRYFSDQSSRFWRLWLALGCALLCGLVSQLQFTRSLSWLMYDSSSRLFPHTTPDDIVIIAIDESSLLEFGRWPWPREKHVALIDFLAKAEPKAIAIDVILSEPDIEYPQVDVLLARAIARQGRVVLPVFMGQIEPAGQLFEVRPLRGLAEAAAGLGHVHIEIDSDGIARSVFLKEGIGKPSWRHLSLVLLEFLQGPVEDYPGIALADENFSTSVTSIVRNYHNYFPVRRAGSFTTISYADVLSGRVPADTFTDKIIFIGATAPGLGDNITTSAGRMSGVEVNANIFDALRKDRLITPYPWLWQLLGSMLFVGLALWFISRLGPRKFILATLLIMIAVVVVSILLLIGAYRWITPVPVVLTLVLAYPLWNWWRLEKAIAYLRRQLDKLRGDRVLRQKGVPAHDVFGKLEFFYCLGLVRSCRVQVSDGEAFQTGAFSLPAVAKDSDAADNQWWHSGNFSGCRVKGGNEEPENAYEILVEWQQDNPQLRRLAEQGLQERTALDDWEQVKESEVVEQTIQQLSLAEHQVEAQRQIVGQSLNQLNSGVILAGLDGHCLLVNQSARRLLCSDMANNRLLELLANIKPASNLAWSDLVSNLIVHGDGFSCEGVVSPGNRDILCHGSLVKLATPLLLFNIIDVSELKRSQREHAAALNFLSHDLRAPLTSVLALIEGARTESGGAINSELLDNIEEYIQRNLSYAENYIHLAKLESTTEERRDECEARSLIDNAIAQVFHYARARGVGFQAPEYDGEIWLYCDRSLVERALANLIDNAIKFSPAGTEIVIDIHTAGGMVIFCVTDQGPGIEEEELAHLFTSFRQGKKRVAGVGLGLKFVAEVSAAHHGRVSVQSTPGTGSTFILELPCASG